MLGVGDRFPQFELKAVVSGESGSAFAAFGELVEEFRDRDAQLLGVSVDSAYVHLAWRQARAELAELPFPMVSDQKRELSTALGIIDREEGVSQRATYVVGPDGIIRFVYITDLNVGRARYWENRHELHSHETAHSRLCAGPASESRQRAVRAGRARPR